MFVLVINSPWQMNERSAIDEPAYPSSSDYCNRFQQIARWMCRYYKSFFSIALYTIKKIKLTVCPCVVYVVDDARACLEYVAGYLQEGLKGCVEESWWVLQQALESQSVHIDGVWPKEAA